MGDVKLMCFRTSLQNGADLILKLRNILKKYHFFYKDAFLLIFVYFAEIFKSKPLITD